MESSKLSMRLVSWALAIAVALGSVPIALAANICDPSTGTNCAGVNSSATGGGIHTSEYDLRSQFTGQKATYTASTTTLTATAAGTGPWFSVCGSGTKTLRIQRFNVNGATATTLSRTTVTLRKTSTATSAGTATALTAVPHDSSSAAATATVLNFYTVLATAGGLVGTVGAKTKLWHVTASPAQNDFMPELQWEFTSRESEGIVLRGTGQCLEAGFGTSTGTAPTLALSVTWTEE